MFSQAVESKLNGVDTEKLTETVGKIARQSGLARFEFRARNKWLGGTHNRTRIKDFYGAGMEDTSRTHAYEFDCGEPPVLCGNEEGANPAEHLLNALAGCVTTSLAVHAAARGVEIESIESELTGDIDVRGFLGLENRVPRGYRSIHVKFKVKSDADAQRLCELAEFSPVYNTLINPTPVRIEIEKV